MGDTGSVEMKHDAGCVVLIPLPCNARLAGEVMIALGKLGFYIPQAVGATAMTVEMTT